MAVLIISGHGSKTGLSVTWVFYIFDELINSFKFHKKKSRIYAANLLYKLRMSKLPKKSSNMSCFDHFYAKLSIFEVITRCNVKKYTVLKKSSFLKIMKKYILGSIYWKNFNIYINGCASTVTLPLLAYPKRPKIAGNDPRHLRIISWKFQPPTTSKRLSKRLKTHIQVWTIY